MRCKMEDEVEILSDDLFDIVLLGEVGVDEFGSVGDSLLVSFREIVSNANSCPIVEESLCEMASDETSSARNENVCVRELHIDGLVT